MFGREKSWSEKEREKYWHRRPWVIGLRLVCWALTLPLAVIAVAGEKADGLLGTIDGALPNVEVRRCCGSPGDHKRGCPDANN